MPSTRIVSRITLGATLVLVGIGGYVRGSGSGYGCADRWPLCENGLLGGLLPRNDLNMIIEWTHRWVAAGVGLLIIATAASAWARHRRARVVVVPSVAAVGVVAVQAWVGRLVVKGNLDADLVSVHLTLSMALVGLLAIVVVATSPPSITDGGGDVRWVMALAVAATGSLGLLILGSLVHNVYVPGYPLVQDVLVPDLGSRTIAIHFAHRALAGLGLFYMAGLAVFAARRPASPERSAIFVAGVAYAANAGVGAAHVFTKVQSSGLVAAHLLLAAIVWALLVAATTAAALRLPSARLAAPDQLPASSTKGPVAR